MGTVHHIESRMASVEAAADSHPRQHDGDVFFSEDEPIALGKTRLFHGTVEYEGARSQYTLEVPMRPISELCMLLVPGYLGVKKVYSGVRHAAAEAGIATATWKPPRRQAGLAGLRPTHLAHPERLLADGTSAVMTALTANHGFLKFILSGHSMGGPAVAEAATQDPERVETAIFCASAGLSEHDLLTLGRRIPRVVTQEIIPNLGTLREQFHTSAILHELRYVAENPYRTLAEGVAVAQSNIIDKVAKLGAMGVHTVAQQFAADAFFPLHEVSQRTPAAVDAFRVFADPNAGHMWPQVEPVSVAHDQLDLAFGYAA